MSKVELRVPDIGESINEVTLATWLVENGDYVEMDEPLCEFDSDKATLEFPSEVSGVIEIVAQEGDDLEIGALVCYIDTSAAPSEEKKEEALAEEAPQVEEKQAEASAPVASQSQTYASGHASPAAQKILNEKGIQAADVQGTGVDGRITKEDAQKAIAPSPKAPAESPKATEETAAPAPVVGSRVERVEKMTRMRRTISRRLVEVKNNTAMLTTFNEVDMTRIMELRKQYKDEFIQEHDVNLGFMSFFIKASTLALLKYPDINAYISDDSIIFHDYCDVSIAVSTPKGLVVPVLRNTEQMSFADIEKDVKRLALLGRDGKLTLSDMEGGTFTITNGGVFGSLLSTPILNQPQSGILGMHKIQERPMVVDGEIKIRPMMYLALSYDHRIVDGKEAVGFLVAIKEYLENPERMLFDI